VLRQARASQAQHDNEWWVRCWGGGRQRWATGRGLSVSYARHDEQRRVHIGGVVLRRLNVQVISIALQRALLEEALCDVWALRRA